MPTGSIFLVPVPIGNLGDITLRALETLRSTPLIASEDTRKTRFLLAQYDIQAPRLISLHKYNEKQRTGELLEQVEQGSDLAVVTDAGSPGISDPAALLISEACGRGIKVVPLPGATALIPAITASGLDPSRFQFLGFLPLRAKDRKAMLQSVRDYPAVSVLYEAPHRIHRTLEDLLEVCGNRQIVIAREISKVFEEFVRGELVNLLADYQITEKGEFVLLVAPGVKVNQFSIAETNEFIRELLSTGVSIRSAAEQASQQFGLGRNEAYQRALELRSKE